MIRSPIKYALSLSFVGLAILAACSPSPPREQTNASTPLTNAPPIQLDRALAQAKAGNKLVFLDFTGSDWCPPCMKLHEKIFSRPEFQAYAESNLVLLVVDFPQKFHLSADAGATNEFLSAKFNIQGFPTLVALDADGKEIWRHLGYIDGGLKELTDDLAAARSKAK
jgi:thiol:disulfide interchange protein